MAKLCFLFGHRDSPASVLPEIERAVEKYYLEYGMDEFVVGNHGSFDRMAAQAVRAVQKKYPSVHLTLLLAYHPSEQSGEFISAYNSTLYPDGMESVPRRFAILRANQYMVSRADGFICYVAYAGNTRALLDESVKRCAGAEIPLINLAAASLST